MTDDALPVLAIMRSGQCKAVRDQLELYDWEDELLTAARINHRTCAWWWGQRMTPAAYGAYCYICDSRIASWSRRWPITKSAQRAVERHKLFHRGEMVSQRSTTIERG